MESLKKSAARTAAPGTDSPRASAPKRAEIKRERIVRSAAKLFLERGYDSVSINDIIAVVGGSKETIYSNFGNKAKLFEAVVQQMCSDVTIRIDTRPIGSLEQQLTRMARSFVSTVITPQILSFHRLVTSIGRDVPGSGEALLRHGPAHGLCNIRGMDCTAAKSWQHSRRQGCRPIGCYCSTIC